MGVTLPGISGFGFAGGGSGSSAVSITDQTIVAFGAGVQTATYRLNTSGIVERGIGATFNSLETWKLSGASSDYEARATLASGDAVSSGTMNTWLGLGTTRDWARSAPLSGDEYNSTLTIEIRLAASPFTVLDTATISLTAIRD